MRAIAALLRARSPGERAVLFALGSVIAIVLYALAITAIDAKRQKLGDRVTLLSAQAAVLERDAAAIERLRGIARAAPVSGDLRTAIESEARTSGVARTLVRLDAKNTHEAEAVLASVAFGDWLAWVSALQRQGIRIETCRIEAPANPGLVNVTATFVRGR